MIVNPDYRIKLCDEYNNLFEEPSTLVDQDIKDQIDLSNPDAPLKY